MRRLLLLVVAVGAVLGAVAPGAHAALGVRDAGPAGRVTVADDRRIAMADPGPIVNSTLSSGPVTVVDVVTGVRATVASPPTCTLADIDRGVILWSCAGVGYAGSGLTQDLATGEQRLYRMPSIFQWQAGDAESARFTRVGARWLQVALGGFKSSSTAWIDRTTGAYRPPRRSADRGKVADLDAVRVTRTLCRGLRAPLVDAAASTPVLVADGLDVVGRAAAATTLREETRRFVSRVVLMRCGRATRILRVCPRGAACSQPLFDGRRVAWIENAGTRTVLRVHDVRTSRRRALTVATGTAAGATQPVGIVRNRLFLVRGTRLLRVTGL